MKRAWELAQGAAMKEGEDNRPLKVRRLSRGPQVSGIQEGVPGPEVPKGKELLSVSSSLSTAKIQFKPPGEAAELLFESLRPQLLAPKALYHLGVKPESISSFKDLNEACLQVGRKSRSDDEEEMSASQKGRKRGLCKFSPLPSFLSLCSSGLASCHPSHLAPPSLLTPCSSALLAPCS